MKRIALLSLLMTGCLGTAPTVDTTNNQIVTNDSDAAPQGPDDMGSWPRDNQDMTKVSVDLAGTTPGMCNAEPNYIRENCIGHHTAEGLPCKVCVGYNSCVTPSHDLYCVSLTLGCNNDPICPADK